MDTSDAIKKAAKLIQEADFMVIATGAGMSADSGLPVYRDTQKVEAYIKRNLSYRDLCTPDWNFEDPETFYGFWGSSLAQFREAVPHEGYDILKKWINQLFSKSDPIFHNALIQDAKLWDMSNPPGPCFVYTSNVDALHLKAGFNASELIEIHGNIETWQCSRACSEDTWPVPKDFVFKVDPVTMLAHAEAPGIPSNFKSNNGFVSNHPRCRNCGDYSRPSVLMFGDLDWIHNKSLWTPWRQALNVILSEKPSIKVVVVEIGCGKTVPSVRWMGESLLNNFHEQCHIIRINREFVNADYTPHQERVVGILGSGRVILQHIDEIIQAQIGQFFNAKTAQQPNLENSKLDDELLCKILQVNL